MTNTSPCMRTKRLVLHLCMNFSNSNLYFIYEKRNVMSSSLCASEQTLSWTSDLCQDTEIVTVKSDVDSVVWLVSEEPLKDSSFLSSEILRFCGDLPVYWQHPANSRGILSNESHHEDTTRVKRHNVAWWMIKKHNIKWCYSPLWIGVSLHPRNNTQNTRQP